MGRIRDRSVRPRWRAGGVLVAGAAIGLLAGIGAGPAVAGPAQGQLAVSVQVVGGCTLVKLAGLEQRQGAGPGSGGSPVEARCAGRDRPLIRAGFLDPADLARLRLRLEAALRTAASRRAGRSGPDLRGDRAILPPSGAPAVATSFRAATGAVTVVTVTY